MVNTRMNFGLTNGGEMGSVGDRDTEVSCSESTRSTTGSPRCGKRS